MGREEKKTFPSSSELIESLKLGNDWVFVQLIFLSSLAYESAEQKPSTILGNTPYKRFISREEFLGEAPKRQPEPESAEKRAERAFKVFDKNHDGYVTKDEMLRLCKNLSKEQARKT